MSDSRLEKFIYAICSMDVSDLPVPLSRIEKLWNCLITGETPDFEPLSRNEKYLMAMLDRYDISNLPAPMSRGEKLLYKIAVGETDLSDVPGYLSRYEELLKYLIENGGISGGDFEYVLYTLNQSLCTLYTTAEKPVKSAILKGQTLVNLVVNSSVEKTVGKSSETEAKYDYIYQLENNKEYTLQFEISNFNATQPMTCSFDNGWNTTDSIAIIDKNGAYKIKFTIMNRESTQIWFYWSTSQWDDGNSATVKNIIILEGDHTQENIPYFEGMQSVKMPVLTTYGKNLIDNEVVNYEFVGASSTGYTISVQSAESRLIIIDAKPSTTYTLSWGDLTDYHAGYIRVGEFKEKTIGSVSISQFTTNIGNSFKTFTTTSQTNFIAIKVKDGVEILDNEQSLMLVEGSEKTSYEPYKSNILTVNEDVTLRGGVYINGELKEDILDLISGEYSMSVGETVLNGSENWGVWYHTDTLLRFSFNYPNMSNSTNIKLQCDNFPSYGYNLDAEGVFGNSGKICLIIDNSNNKLLGNTVNDLKTYLSQNPITVQYSLKEKSIKTVDLTVVDQDNQPTQLGTFENLTHVSLEAEGLIPEVEMEVATIISEELASASPLMDDISNKQQQLEATVDEQSNNVDATMIATTEIYEETL